jgi:hypothetical protein
VGDFKNPHPDKSGSPFTKGQRKEQNTKIWILLTQELIGNNKKLIENFENDW